MPNPPARTPPTPDQIADILFDRRPVYGLNIDSLIRQAANRLTARAFLEYLARTDPTSADFPETLEELLVRDGIELTYVIGFHDASTLPLEGPDDVPPETSAEPAEFHLRLVFRDEDAAYYQFSLFPSFNSRYVLGASRKRAGATQHLNVTLASKAYLQTFIEECRSNPHLLRIEESTAEEFERAPSHGV